MGISQIAQLLQVISHLVQVHNIKRQLIENSYQPLSGDPLYIGS